MMEMSNVINFYSGQTMFITGATGFMGKVLLEKILRTMPDIIRIYILIRPKKGFSPEERIATILQNKPFTLNEIDQDQLKKVIAVKGDIVQKDLGLSDSDRAILINEVSIVHHLAASVRFDLPLKEAVRYNVRGTKALLELCREMKHLKSVLHLSTAFCNLDIDIMEEKVYDIPNISPYKIMDFVEWVKDEDIAKIEKSMIEPHPNTYTYTKRLSEIVVKDMGRNLPLVIVRPSIVLAACEEPIPGWVDTLSGPAGLIVAAGKGVLQIGLVDEQNHTEYIPVDMAVDIIIVASSIRGTTEFSGTPVYNATRTAKHTWGEALRKGRESIIESPLRQVLWHQNNYTTKYKSIYTIGSIFLHFVPAILIDFVLIMFLQEPFLLSLQKKIYTTSLLTSYFASKEYNFSKEGIATLQRHMNKTDLRMFNVSQKKLDVDQYLNNCFLGIRTFVNEEPSDNIIWKVKYYIYYALDKLLKIWVCYGIYTLFK